MICEDCKEELVKASIELSDGDWIVAWLCECEPDLKAIRKGKESWAQDD